MKAINFDERNVSVTMNYQDLQQMLKETVLTTMKEVQEEAKKKENQKWFDSKDTAKMFGVSASTINRWKHSGYLNPKSLGGRDFFSIEDINHLMVTKDQKCA